MGEKIKTCTKCKFIGDDSLFIKRQNLCLECKKRAGREDRAKRGEELNRKQRENYHKTPEQKAQEKQQKKIDREILPRTCIVCDETKERVLFYGHKNTCITCSNRNAKEYHEKNKPARKEQSKIYRENNKEKIKKKSAIYYEENKEIISIKSKIKYEENRVEILEGRKNAQPHFGRCIKCNENKTLLKLRNICKLCYKQEFNSWNKNYTKNKWEEDPFYRLGHLISSLVRRALKNQNGSKMGDSTFEYLPYSKADLILHIEKQFEPWMNWNNQGQYNSKTWDDNDYKTWKWQLDHIIPHSDFKYDSLNHSDFQKCWALENLRPLSAKINLLEGVNRIRHKKVNK